MTYWSNEIAKLRDGFLAQGHEPVLAAFEARGKLVMNMVYAGLATPDGTEGKSYIENRLEVAEFAVEQQLAQNESMPVSLLLDIFKDINATDPSVPQGKCEVSTFFDETAPTQQASISTASDNFGANQGIIGDGGTTDDTSPLLAGTLTAPLALCETLEVYRDGVVVGVAMVNGSQWTFADSGLSNGLHSYSVRVVDLAGNRGAASNVYQFTLQDDILPPPVDTTAPLFVSADVSGNELTLEYNEALNDFSNPAGSSFTVMVDGQAVEVTSANALGSRVFLTLKTPVADGQTVTVSYTPPSTSPTEDLAGNDAAALNNAPVENRSPAAPDTTPPVLQSATVNGATLTLTYNEALNAASDPDIGSFVVEVNGTTVYKDSADANGTTVTLTLSEAVTCGQIVTVTYAQPAYNPIEDLAGNDAAAIDSRQAVTNITPVTSAPITYTPFIPFVGTTENSSDASTAIALDSNWMIVGDDEANALAIYDRDGGAAITFYNYANDLSITGGELDLEASARIDGDTLVFVGSHSNKKSGNEDDNREHIFTIDVNGTGASISVSNVVDHTGLESALATWDSSNAHNLGANYFGFAASSATGTIPEQVSGFSIEGATTSLDGSELILGFRAPQSDTTSRDTAVLVGLNLADLLAGTFNITSNTELDLGGRGIRSIEKADDGSGYLIIAGPAGSATDAVTHDFRLFTFDGIHTPTELDNDLDSLLASTGGSFESIVGLSSINSGTCVQLLQDNGDTIWPGKTDVSKDLPAAEQQFQGNVLKLGNAVNDVTGPLLVSSSPADDAIDVSRSSNIVLTFNEGVQVNAAGSFIIRKASDNTPVANITADDATQVSVAFNIITINPTADLDSATGYYLEVDNSAVGDHEGNAWVGITGATALNFTTAVGAPTYSLLITEVNSNATGGDFFELYNYGTSAIDLTGWKWDDEAASFSTSAVAFTAGTSIAAGERIIVAAVTTDASALRAAWGIPGSVQVIAVGGSTLAKQDAVVVFDAAGNVATAFNYDTTSVTASDGTIITTALASMGTSFSDNQHAGTAYNGGVSVDKSSAVWDGISTINPTYKAAVVGDLGAYAQCDGVSIGSLGGTIARGYNPSTPYTESFATNLGAFTVYSVDASQAPQTWYHSGTAATGSTIGTAEVNGYGDKTPAGDTAPANDWLISQSFDLTQTSVEYLSFTTWAKFSDAGVANPEVKLFYSTNYSGTGSPTAATWTALSYTPSADNSQVTTPSGLIDLSGINGCNVYFAFQYTSSGTGSGSSSQWRVDDFNVTGYNGAVLSVAATSANKAEGNSGSTAFTFTVTRAGDTTGAATVDYAISGTAVDAADFGGTLPTGTVTFAATETSKVVTINVNGDTTSESSEAFTLTLSNASAGSTIVQASATGTIQDDDAAATLISAVQGSGAASTLDGSIVTVEAIVTAIMPGLNGFYIQEEAADSDANASTSEGIFVYGSAAGFNVGDLVRLTAEVDEFSGLTELKNITSSSVVSTGNALPTASVITLPVADMINWEALEGMLVNVQSSNGNLVITDNYNLGRYGQVTLTSETLLQQFTETNDPDVAGYTAYQAMVQKDQIIIDDNQTAQNPAVHPGRDGNYLSASNTLRAGDSISSVVGVVDQYVATGPDAPKDYETTYRIQPTIEPVFTGAARPTSADLPAAVTNAEIKVASVNVLNYFTTLDNGGTFTNPNGTTHDPRGANDAAEFTRQQDKLVANLLGLDADVVALMEIQNNGFGDGTSAIDALVDALNAASAPGTYAYVTGPYPDGTAPDAATAGDDAIMVAFLYKPSAVTVVGKAVADPSTYDAFSATYGNRVPVAVTFQSKSDNEVFTAVANHFKSKSSADATQGSDQNDGAGQSYAARMEAARDLLDWLATNPTGNSDSDILLLGDFNAYSHEDPITFLTNTTNGYEKVSTGLSYSYDGLWGSLDHALASDSLASQVAGAVKWAINAEEPALLDYETENKDAAQVINYYAADAYRSSDHNPVLIGLNLGGGAPDTTPPVLVSAAVNGTSMVLTYNEVLSNTNTNFPDFTDFVVTVGGTPRSVTGIAVTGATLTLTLAVAVLAGETVTVRYTDPTAGNDANAVQDLAGNDAATFSAVNATNNTPAPDITAPTLVSSTPADEATGVARTADIVLTFSENVKAGTGNILIKEVVNGNTFATIAVSDAKVSVSGTQVTINPSSDLVANTNYYIEMAAGVIEDVAGNDFAGLSATATGGTDAYELDFTTTATSTTNAITENFNNFKAAGFVPNPTSTAELDSDIWIVTGNTDSLAPSFGASLTTIDFVDGTAGMGQVTTGHTLDGGVHAFDVGDGNIAFGIQPTGNDVTPGALVLKLTNTTGSTINSFSLDYDLFVNNDQPRSNSINVQYSLDNSTWTNIDAFNYASPDIADASPAWIQQSYAAQTVGSLNLANGLSLYVRWYTDDVSGSGNRDEFAFDNIVVDWLM